MKSELIKMKYLGMALLGALVLTSCLNTDDNDQSIYENTSWGAFINVSPDSENLQFLSDGNLINSTPADYSQYFGYVPLQAGTREFKVRSENEVLDTLSLNMENGKRYSIFAINNFENLELISFPDEVYAPEAGKSLMRFIQLSPDAPQLRVSIEGQESLGTFNYKQSSGFVQVNETLHKDLYLIDEATQDTLLTKEIELSNGKIYSVFSKGFLNSENENQQLDIQIISVFL